MIAWRSPVSGGKPLPSSNPRPRRYVEPVRDGSRRTRRSASGPPTTLVILAAVTLGAALGPRGAYAQTFSQVLQLEHVGPRQTRTVTFDSLNGSLFAIYAGQLVEQAARSDLALSQAPITMVKRVGRVEVARVAPDGSVADTIYRSEAVSVNYLTVSPSRRFLGLLETIELTNLSHRLVVLDAAGNVASVVERDLQRYVWCCGENRIALITGSYVEARGSSLSTLTGPVNLMSPRPMPEGKVYAPCFVIFAVEHRGLGHRRMCHTPAQHSTARNRNSIPGGSHPPAW